MAIDNDLQTSFLFERVIASQSVKRSSQHMLMVSAKGMLVNRDPTSKLAMKWLVFCLPVSSAKVKYFLTEYSLLVKGAKRGTRYLAKL